MNSGQRDTARNWDREKGREKALIECRMRKKRWKVENRRGSKRNRGRNIGGRERKGGKKAED